jgi:hypothetical protein
VQKVRITNRQLVEADPGLQELRGLKLPVRAAYDLGASLRNVGVAVTLYNEQREKITNDNAKKDAEGKNISPAPGQVALEDFTRYASEIKELNEIEIELLITPINLGTLGDREFSAGSMAVLGGWFIVGDS